MRLSRYGDTAMLLRLDKTKAADSDGPMATEIGGSWWTGDARRETESCLNWKARNRKLLMKIRLSDGIDWERCGS